MERFGGSFVKALALAWRHADPENAIKLREAFRDIWDTYEALAKQTTKSPKPVLTPHPFVSTPKDGPCSSCGRKRYDRVHDTPENGW